MNRVVFTTLVALVLAFSMLSAQTVDVHFMVNTATVPDTLGMNSVVQVRGSVSPLSWDGNSAVMLKNLGADDEWGSSDYWMGTATFPADTIVYYKFYTNASHDTVFGGAEWEHQGWEADVAPEQNDRILDLRGFAGTDTVLQLQFVNGYAERPGQYAPPFETNDSSFVVWLRVNMQGWEAFDPEQHKVGVRGSNTADWGQTGELSWGSTYFLSPENPHANGGSQQYDAGYFYSGAIHVPNQYADAGIQWKFVVHFTNSPADDDWGNMAYNPGLEENVSFSGSGADTSFYWRWYDRLRPGDFEGEDTVVISFKADMAKAIAGNGFTPGDSVVVRAGWNSTANEVYTSPVLEKEGLIGNIYSATDTIITNIGIDLEYNYYVIKEGIEYREVFFDFTDESGGSSQEKRKININSTEITVEDNSNDISSLRRQPEFRNLDEIADSTHVVFTVDMRPAYYTVLSGKTLDDIQSVFDVTEADSVIAWGVRMNGPATGGWQSWGTTLYLDTTRTMYDDGTNGDEVAGDSIYSITIPFSAGSVKGQEFKFGIHGGDNEGGYGNNHVENIDDSQFITYIHSQFGSIDPLFYDAWNFETGEPSAVDDEFIGKPRVYTLNQNYPNPFNPETKITYTLANNGKVSLEVYNIIGQKVRTIFDGYATAGTHIAKWSGLDDQGQKVASGVYFYKLKAGDFVSTKKMVMLK